MKIVTRTRIVLFATLGWLAVSTALAAGPTAGPRYRSPRVAAHPDARSRISSRTTAQASPQAAAPEQIAAPPPSERMYSYQGDPAMWDEQGGYFDDGGYFEDGGYRDDGSRGPYRTGLWHFSLDYLLIRPRLSQGVAAVRETRISQQSGTTVNGESIGYKFDYNSSFRLALGYRLLDCGGDIQFSYWRLTGNASIFDGPAVTESNALIILGQLGNDPGDGQFLSANTDITANIYDIDFAKSLSFGGSGGPYDCGFCPRWDLRFLAGIRIGDVSRFNNNAVTDSDGDVISYGDIDARFIGAGPRLGVQGRRYFGACDKYSVFAKGSQALLIGDYDMTRALTTVSSGNVTSQIDSFGRIIPVTDLELGATWQVAPYAFASIGWLWQAWWDLGQAENISGSSFGPLDSSNILGFDGLFVRGELLF